MVNKPGLFSISTAKSVLAYILRKSRLFSTPGSLVRYYINKSYARWSHNVKGRVLEIGGGRDERYTKNSITLDISNNFNPDILASGYNLPFKDNAFDTVISMEVLEHLENPKLIINEIHRVLKPNGGFFLTTRFIHEIHGEDYFRYTKLSLETLFKRFKAVEVEEHGSVFSVLFYLLTFIFPSARAQAVLNVRFHYFYPLIARIDQRRIKIVTLGYSIYGRK